MLLRMSAPARQTEFEVGPEPYRFTIEDVLHMMKKGVLAPDARVELLDGEIIQMPGEGAPHKRYKAELARYLNRTLGDDLVVAIDSTLNLGVGDAPDPDVHIYPAAVMEEDLTAADVLLVIEVADSSIAYDLNRKAKKYAQYGIVEYWVVDVQRRVTHVFRSPRNGQFRERHPVSLDQPLTAARVPDLRLVIADLPRL